MKKLKVSLSFDDVQLSSLSPFSRKVLRVVSQIPFGQVRTYAWVARKAGKPKASRAVGQIMHHNPYPLLVPCHRVVAGNGSGGYAFGVKVKEKLLKLEKNIVKNFLRVLPADPPRRAPRPKA